MPPAVGAIIATVGSVIIGTIKASILVKALLTIALTVATTLLTQKPTANRIDQGNELKTKIDPNMPRQVLCGKVATGGSCHFVYTGTNDSDKPNRYLYRVIQLSDQPCNSFEGLFDGTNEITFAGDVTTGWFAATNAYRTKSGSPCFWMRVYLGKFSGAVADSTLVSETGGLWSSAHKGTGLCYAIIKMDFDPDAFSGGEPQFVWVMEGAALYDERADSTGLGSGSHRVNTPTTWTYSDTASLITGQYLRGFTINGVRILGVGASTEDLDPASMISAHNTCDQSVTIDGGTEKRYAAGIVISGDERAVDVLSDLSAAMDGKIFDRGGAITVLPGATRTPVLTIDDNSIIWSEEKSFQPHAPLQSMVNCVKGSFVDAGNYFAQADLPVLTNSTWEAQDGGERFTTSLSLRAVTSRTQGMRITKRLHESSRFNSTVAVVCPIWFLELEQGDWFTLNSNRFNKVATYEVSDITITSDMKIALVGTEVSSTTGVWDHSVDEVPRNDTTWNPPAYILPVPNIYTTATSDTDPVTGITNFAVFVGLIDTTALTGYVKSVEVRYKKTGVTDANATTLGSFRPDQKGMSANGLLPDTEYQFSARSSDGARVSNWSNWVTVHTLDPIPLTSDKIIHDLLTPTTISDEIGEIKADAATLLDSVGDISTQIIAQATEITGINSTLLTFDSEITNNSNAISGLSGSLASTQLLLIAGSPNLLPNGDFSTGDFTSWSSHAGWFIAHNDWGYYAYRQNITGSPVELSSDLIPCLPNTQYTVHGDVELISNSTASAVYLDFTWYDSSNIFISDSGENKLYSNPSIGFKNDGSNRNRIKLTATSPANAAKMVVRYVVEPNGGTVSEAGVRQIKVEKGTLATAFSSEASVTQIYSAVTSNTTSIASMSSTLATQGSAITTNANAITTLNSNLSSLVTTVATQGASISSNSSAISTLEDNLADLTITVGSVGSEGANLLKNSSFENGFADWDVLPSYSVTGYPFNIVWGACIYWYNSNYGFNTDQVYIQNYSPAYRTQVVPNAPYTFSGDVSFFADNTNAYFYLDITIIDDAGNIILDGPQTPHYGPANDFSNSIQRRRDLKCTITTPNVAYPIYAVCRLVANAGGGTINLLAVRQFKLEIGSEATAYNTSANIVQQYQSINGAFARAALKLDVNGYVTGWEVNNNGSVGNMVIQADNFAVVKSTGGAKTVYSNGAWKIYDASNVLRVQLGNLDV